MKVLIVGGSGFLGSYVADALSRKGHKVIIFDKKKSRWLQRKQKMIIGDIQNVSLLEKVIKGSEIVYNFAAIADIGEALEDPMQTVKTNILGIVNILELCKKYQVKRFVFASSIYVYSNQGGFYRVSKQASELFVEEYSNRYKLNYTILRFGSIYGPRSDIRNGLSKIISYSLKTGAVRYGGTAKAVRQFIHVNDAAKASVDILKRKFINQNVLITGRKTSKIKELLYLIAKILNIPKKPKFDNKIQQGHYNVTPFSYKPKPGKKYYTQSSIQLRQGIMQLIDEIKKRRFK